MSMNLHQPPGLFKSQATLIPTFSLKGRRGKFPRPYWGEAIARRLCGILPRYGRAIGVRGDVKRLLKSRDQPRVCYQSVLVRSRTMRS